MDGVVSHPDAPSESGLTPSLGMSPGLGKCLGRCLIQDHAPFLGRPISDQRSTYEYKGLPPPTWESSEGTFIFKAPDRVSFYGDCIRTQLPSMLSSLLHRCWSSEHFPISLHCTVISVSESVPRAIRPLDRKSLKNPEQSPGRVAQLVRALS